MKKPVLATVDTGFLFNNFNNNTQLRFGEDYERKQGFVIIVVALVAMKQLSCGTTGYERMYRKRINKGSQR